MHLVILSLAILFGLAACYKNATLECAKMGSESLNHDAKVSETNRDDQVLLDSAQDAFKEGIAMVHKRAMKTKLDCYYEFTKKYLNALKQTSATLNDRLSKAVSATERSDAISSIAWMSQVVKCDEQYRALHHNETSECSRDDESAFESKFGSLYNKLKSQAYWSNMFSFNKNKIIESMIINDLKLYSKTYGEARNCILRQRKTERCINYKIFAEELDRFFSLFGTIQKGSKVSRDNDELILSK